MHAHSAITKLDPKPSPFCVRLCPVCAGEASRLVNVELPKGVTSDSRTGQLFVQLWVAGTMVRIGSAPQDFDDVPPYQDAEAFAHHARNVLEALKIGKDLPSPPQGVRNVRKEVIQNIKQKLLSQS